MTMQSRTCCNYSFCFVYLALSLQTNFTSAMAKVTAGEIAFVWESAILENIAGNDVTCRFTTVSIGAGEFYYAFALKKNSLYTSTIDAQLITSS